ncbi:hypothetical protein MKX01_026659 [Papaver californicum]|nr:hypothetical protein MKX01_026659 [Papaver californicum]
MARNWWSHGYTVTLIGLSSFILFYSGFQMAIQNSSKNIPSMDSVSTNLNSERRSRLYDKMEHDLEEHGATFLQGGETSQSLSLSDIFAVKDGIVKPILKAANPPVRANVLYLSTNFSIPILQAVKGIFQPYFNKKSSLYHFSMFHASHHIVAVPATEDEIEAEATAVKAVVETLCPLKIVLDRVVLTSTGVLLGCWQVSSTYFQFATFVHLIYALFKALGHIVEISYSTKTPVTSGTDPVYIRERLRNVLPNAPEKQLYDPAMLHTSFARLLGHPKLSVEELHKQLNQLQFFHELVMHLNNKIRGFELWYVEEFDMLALALNGRIKPRKFYLGCSNNLGYMFKKWEYWWKK